MAYGATVLELILCIVTALLVLCVPMQAAAERQLREQGQLPSAAAAGAETAAGGSEAAAAPEAAVNGDAAPEAEAAGAAAAGAGGSKKGKVVSAKDKEEALLKAKRKEIMERAGTAGHLVGASVQHHGYQALHSTAE
jgi:hypothetical protein